MKGSVLRKIYKEFEIEIIDQVRAGEKRGEYDYWAEETEQARQALAGEAADRFANTLERREQLVMEECFVQGWRMGTTVLMESLYGCPRDPQGRGGENA